MKKLSENFPIDEQKFTAARTAALMENTSCAGIGTLSEKVLHKILKLYIEPNEENHEVKYLGSVADIKNESGIVEIQTRNYDKLVPKLLKFLDGDAVTVVCPLAAEKTQRWLNSETGEITAPRKSPKKENVFDAMKLLYGIRSVIPHPRLTVRVMYLSVEDFRYLNGWDKTGKRGSTRMERIPNRILSEQTLATAADFAAALPASLPPEFTVPDLARAIKRTPRFTFYVAKLLLSVGAITECGTRGRARTYTAAL